MDEVLRSLSIKVSEFKLDFESCLRILAINLFQYFPLIVVLLV